MRSAFQAVAPIRNRTSEPVVEPRHVSQEYWSRIVVGIIGDLALNVRVFWSCDILTWRNVWGALKLFHESLSADSELGACNVGFRTVWVGACGVNAFSAVTS